MPIKIQYYLMLLMLTAANVRDKTVKRTT